MFPPRTLADVEELIAEEIAEDIHLDYKDSRALIPSDTRVRNSIREDLTKDVSAFANSDGGVLIYGVQEDQNTHVPLRIDDGVPRKWGKEWAENVLAASVTPRLEGVSIATIPISDDAHLLIVDIPKSPRAPHQAADKRYYKRFNSSSFPMEDYQVRDTLPRRCVVEPLLAVRLDISQGVLLALVVENTSSLNALEVSFELSPELATWAAGSGAPFLQRAPL